MTRAPYPYPIADRNPLDGEPWTLSARTLRELLAHCLDSPAFAEPDNAADLFVCRADLELRRLERQKKTTPPVATLQSIATHAEALARALDRLTLMDPGPLPHQHYLGEFWRASITAAARRGVTEPPLQLQGTLRAMADGARASLAMHKPKRARGQRDTLATFDRALAIESLWNAYPEPLRSTERGTHFMQTMTMLFGRPESTWRALQTMVRRDLARMAAFRKKYL